MVKGLMDRSEDFEKPWCFKLREDMLWLRFLKGHSGYCMEKRIRKKEGTKVTVQTELMMI